MKLVASPGHGCGSTVPCTKLTVSCCLVCVLVLVGLGYMCAQDVVVKEVSLDVCKELCNSDVY